MPHYQVFIRGIATEIVDVEDAESWDDAVTQAVADFERYGLGGSLDIDHIEALPQHSTSTENRCRIWGCRDAAAGLRVRRRAAARCVGVRRVVRSSCVLGVGSIGMRVRCCRRVSGRVGRYAVGRRRPIGVGGSGCAALVGAPAGAVGVVPSVIADMR